MLLLEVNMWDVIIIGAGASGLMCAIEAGKRGRRVLVLDHSKRGGQKIMICGGGRCNFTNLSVEPSNYICANPHFVRSCLSRYTQWDFIALVDKHKISWHERDHGQLFCDESAIQIVDMLLKEARDAKVKIQLNCTIEAQKKIADNHFSLSTSCGEYQCQSLVIATGGLSYAVTGATALAYEIAQSYEIPVRKTRPGLVPLTFSKDHRKILEKLSGISLTATLTTSEKSGKKAKKISFTDSMLFTYSGLSGPVVLQISNYWEPGNELSIDLLPQQSLSRLLEESLKDNPNQELKTLLSQLLPKRLIETLLFSENLKNLPVKQYNHKDLEAINSLFHNWQPSIGGTKWYKTAEVTLGGIDTDYISPKTMECKTVKGLYFTGEALDVTGWLGGYNLTFAWSSGWAAGQDV
jgi:hypothetical protein